MNFIDALRASASGLSAQRLRMNVIASNLANANTTRTADGGPYRRRDVVFQAESADPRFGDVLQAQLHGHLTVVKVVGVVEDGRPLPRRYDPQHPDADADGYVTLPNVQVVEEMVNMITASRSYEANLAAVRATKTMAQKALEIGK